MNQKEFRALNQRRSCIHIACAFDCEKALFEVGAASRIDPNDYWLFEDLKKMIVGKKFCSNEEVIAETKAYFEAQFELFQKSGIEMLERRWNKCVGNYVG